MDYLPPERPAIVAQAKPQASDRRGEAYYEFVDLGMIDALPEPQDWTNTKTYEQRQQLHELKPGQREIFAKPDTQPQPVYYMYQHKPCSSAAFTAFRKILRAEVGELERYDLESVHELLGTRAEKGCDTKAGVMFAIKTPVLRVFSRKVGEKNYSECIFAISDAKQRLVQEIGFEGAKPGEHFSEEARDMLNGIELKPAK